MTCAEDQPKFLGFTWPALLATIERACWTKNCFDGSDAAWAVAHRARDIDDEAVSAYRCPFACGEVHWHVGHVPSLRSLELLAAAVRFQGQHPDAVDDVRERSRYRSGGTTGPDTGGATVRATGQCSPDSSGSQSLTRE